MAEAIEIVPEFGDVRAEEELDWGKLADYLTSRKADLMKRIAIEKALNDALTNDLKATVIEFKQTYR